MRSLSQQGPQQDVFCWIPQAAGDTLILAPLPAPCGLQLHTFFQEQGESATPAACMLYDQVMFGFDLNLLHSYCGNERPLSAGPGVMPLNGHA